MSTDDPQRELDDPDLPAEWRRALQAGRHDGPGASRRARLRRSVMGGVGAGAAAGAASSAAASASTGPSAGGMGILAKVVIGTGIAAGVATAGAVSLGNLSSSGSAGTAPADGAETSSAHTGESEAIPQTAASAKPAASEDGGTRTSDADAGVAKRDETQPRARSELDGDARAERARQRHTRSTQPAKASNASPEPEARSAGRELELIRRAHRAIEADPEQALELVAEHETRFPSGTFVQEREVIAIEALIRAGRAGRARQRAQRFFATHPRSSHAPRVRRLLAESKEGGRDRTHEGEAEDNPSHAREGESHDLPNPY